jgi:hypothetical protein
LFVAVVTFAVRPEAESKLKGAGLLSVMEDACPVVTVTVFAEEVAVL